MHPVRNWLVLAAVMSSGWWLMPSLDAACCYFAAKGQDVLQPAQKVFITWDPNQQLESFTVQPKFAGDAVDFGMVIPTPSRPRLDAVPRDFFKHLAVYSILKRREFPQSRLAFWGGGMMMGGMGMMGMGGMMMGGMGAVPLPAPPRPRAVKVLETGLVGSLDYKIIEAGRADDLFDWLKAHRYRYAGDEATLQHYIQKKWLFTVMKIDTMQMKRNKKGIFDGEVTPTRFQFRTAKLVYPLKITQLSVKDKTEALFYVQAPYKVDLPGDMSYQHTWVPMLQAASVDSDGKRIPSARSLRSPGVAGYTIEVQVFGHGHLYLPFRPPVSTTLRAFTATPFDIHSSLQACDPTTLTSPRLDGLALVSNAGAQQFVTAAGKDRGGMRTGNGAGLPGISLDDPDRDGYCEEISEGDLDVCEWYLLNHPAPARGRITEDVKKGERTFHRLGCAVCHVRDWHLFGSSPAAKDYTQRFDGDRRFFELQVAFNESASRLEGKLH